MKKFTFCLALSAFCLTAAAQQSYLIDKDVAVFYPKDYQATAHQPSPVFVNELVPQGGLPSGWKIRPEYKQEGGKQVVTLRVDADADLYGTGEVIGDLQRNNKDVTFWNMDNYGYLANQGKNLYQSHPWVLGVRKDGSAFGIIADNTWRSTLNTGNPIRFESDGPAFRVVVIEAKDVEGVMQKLSTLTGHMELPPLWALGYQQCRYSYYPDSRVKEIADKLRAERIPCDVIWMDIDYMDKFKIFTFDKKTFPNPKGLHTYLHQKDFKSVYMIDPGVKVENGYFVDDQGSAANYWVKDKDGKPFVGKVWPGNCHFPDFTRPEVRMWWAGLYTDFMAKGVDGVWNDMNEPAVFEGVENSMPADNKHLGGDGMPADSHLRYHNIYGYNMVKASRQGILNANPDKRPFVLSRSNFLGGQRYAATWNGDNMSSWEHLLQSIPMTLNLGLSGQPFNGPDMGGFGADCDPELLAHWTATGIYFPFARNHAAKGTVDQEPWAFGEKVENVCRTAIERRYRLLPYIYTLFEEAATNGMPVMRPAFMADEKDTTLHKEQEAYMLGKDLYIIPRWAKNAKVPMGDWDVLQLEDKDDLYQAFVALRPGAIVPLAQLYQNTEEYKTDSLTLLVNPLEDGTARGTLYDDAGDGFGYRTGDYARYELVASSEDHQLTVHMKQVAGNRTLKHVIRIGFVTDHKITYSPWVEGTSVSMKYVSDKQKGIQTKKLKFSAIDPAKEPSTKDKLKIQMEKMKQAGQDMNW